MSKEKKIWIFLTVSLFFLASCLLTFFHCFPLDILNHERYQKYERYLKRQKKRLTWENNIIWNISQSRKKMEITIIFSIFLFILYLIINLILYIFYNFYRRHDQIILFFLNNYAVGKIKNALLWVTIIYDLLLLIDLLFFLIICFRLDKRLQKITNNIPIYHGAEIAWEYISSGQRYFFIFHFFFAIFASGFICLINKHLTILYNV